MFGFDVNIRFLKRLGSDLLVNGLMRQHQFAAASELQATTYLNNIIIQVASLIKNHPKGGSQLQTQYFGTKALLDGCLCQCRLLG